MKNVFVCLVLLFALSCSKAVVPEQKVFENLPSCCKLPTTDCDVFYKQAYTLNDIVGQLYATSYSGAVPIYDGIRADTLYKIKIPDAVLPLYKYCIPDLNPCNMPKEIINSMASHKVKFSCRIPYFPLPTPPERPECLGLTIELLRIELID